MIFTEISRDNRINLRPLCKKSKPKKYRRNDWPLKNGLKKTKRGFGTTR